MNIQTNRVYPTSFRTLETFFVTDVTDEFVSGYHVPFGFNKEMDEAGIVRLQRNFFEGMVKATAESKAKQFDHLLPRHAFLRERAEDMRAILENRDRPERSIYDFVYIDILLVKSKNFLSSDFNDFWDYADRLTGGCCNSMFTTKDGKTKVFECSMTGVGSLGKILQDKYVEPVGIAVTAPKELMSPVLMPDLLRAFVAGAASLPSIEAFKSLESFGATTKHVGGLAETNAGACGDKPKVRG